MQPTRTTVAVIGGGYGGVAVARELDDVTDVVLVEPRDAFVHNVAALRTLVDPQWTDRVFYPYDRLLANGRVLRDRAVDVDVNGTGASIALASGTRIHADYAVLATGSGYPFPAKVDVDDSASATAKLRATHRELADARRVLLLGAGPVGLELAGEIKSVWADKDVTIVEPGPDIVAGDYPDRFRAELRRQLDALGVRLVFGTRLRESPRPGIGENRTFTATLDSGQHLTADIWFRCFGVTPTSDYLGGGLAAGRRPDGTIEVSPELRVAGRPNVFAVGDITALPEAKQAGAAVRHAAVVAANIRTLLDGGDALTAYRSDAPTIMVPLGTKGGATYLPGWRDHLDSDTVAQIQRRSTGEKAELLRLDILDAEATSQFKGADLLTGMYAAIFGQ
jgi:NADH dehydrogenase FAD-containing subunit